MTKELRIKTIYRSSTIELALPPSISKYYSKNSVYVTFGRGPLEIFELDCGLYMPESAATMSASAHKRTLPPGFTYTTVCVSVPFGEMDWFKTYGQGIKNRDHLVGILALSLDSRLFEEIVFDVHVEDGKTGLLHCFIPRASGQLDEHALDKTNRIIDIYNSSPVLDERVRLCLRWYLKGITGEPNIDKFLALWLALELWAQSKNPNIIADKIQTSLLTGYDKAIVKAGLELGQMFGRRGELVHNGNYMYGKKEQKYVTRLENILEECLRHDLGLELKEVLDNQLSQFSL